MNRKTQIANRLVAVMIALAATERALAQKPSPAQPAPDQRRIVVNIPAMELRLYRNGEIEKSYRVAVGKTSTPSPTGNFRLASLVKDPVWYGPKKQVAAAGPQNPVGTRWMGLDQKGYGIHGTNAPKSIGRAASHGCIRMKNTDAEDLFQRVQVGDAVEIVYDLRAAGPQAKDVYNRAALVARDAGDAATANPAAARAAAAAAAANGGN